jgi:hypothetical protein
MFTVQFYILGGNMNLYPFISIVMYHLLTSASSILPSHALHLQLEIHNIRDQLNKMTDVLNKRYRI